jgi:hypothetical protein
MVKIIKLLLFWWFFLMFTPILRYWIGSRSVTHELRNRIRQKLRILADLDRDRQHCSELRKIKSVLWKYCTWLCDEDVFSIYTVTIDPLFKFFEWFLVCPAWQGLNNFFYKPFECPVSPAKLLKLNLLGQNHYCSELADWRVRPNTKVIFKKIAVIVSIPNWLV